jgi:hypothetical protein
MFKLKNVQILKKVLIWIIFVQIRKKLDLEIGVIQKMLKFKIV